MKSIRSNKYTILLFVAVPMLIYVFFALIPILYNIYISLFDTNLLTPGKFVGLKNYARLLKDTTFLRALRNNIFLVIGSLAAHMGLGLFFANAIFQKVKGSKFFQSVFFLPSVICGVAVGLIWTFVYHGNYGLLNAFLKLIGQGDLQQVWLSNKNLALICIIVVVMWQWVGYHVVIQLAAIKSSKLRITWNKRGEPYYANGTENTRQENALHLAVHLSCDIRRHVYLSFNLALPRGV